MEQAGERKNTSVINTPSQAGSLPLAHENNTALKDVLFICKHVSVLRKLGCCAEWLDNFFPDVSNLRTTVIFRIMIALIVPY